MPDLLVATNLSAGYGSHGVLHGASLTLRAGEVVAVVGPNGGGKSTLLRALIDPSLHRGGTAIWFDRNVTQWSPRALARQVAVLPQAPTWLAGQTVRDLLAAGRAPHWGLFGVESRADAEAVEAVAESLGLTAWLARDASALSGGQRQRATIARSVVQIHGSDSAAILLDEPDAHLDLRRVAELADLIRWLSRERALGVLLASHDLNLAASVADRVALLRGGRVSATGAPAEVLTAERVSAAYETPVRVIESGGVRLIVPAR